MFLSLYPQNITHHSFARGRKQISARNSVEITRREARPAGSEVRRTSEEVLHNMEHGVGHREMSAARRRNTTQVSVGYMHWNYQQRADPGGAVDVGDRLGGWKQEGGSMIARTMQARARRQAKRHGICPLSMTSSQPIPISPSIAKHVKPSIFVYSCLPCLCFSFSGLRSVQISLTALPHRRYCNIPDALSSQLSRMRRVWQSNFPRNSHLRASVSYICGV